jgi:lipopolysaccharide export system permease protein
MVAFVSIYLSPKALRELRSWVTDIRANMIGTIVQPGRFAVLDNKLTIHIRHRVANGQLLGVLIDDQRNPKERVTILAEKGDIATNDRGTYLVLESGTAQRHEAGQRDPTIVRFDQYAFDLSRLASASPQAIVYSVQERYVSELMESAEKDPRYSGAPGQLTAELHNRITAPLYPLVFLVVTFAYLGAPRTTRQSRAISILGATAAVAAVRVVGFVGVLAGAQKPVALATPYLAIFAAAALGAWAISRGVIIEPPAFIMNSINAALEVLSRRSAQLLGRTR